MQSEAIRDELLKIDRRGHVLVKRERREALLDEYERCGVSAAEFAAQIGVKYQTFAHWQQKRKNQRQALLVQAAAPVPAALMAPQPGPGLRWVEAEVEAGVQGEQVMAIVAALKLELPGGASVELSTPGQMKLAAELLKALAAKGQTGC
ncbi:MAG: IS66 family insertion sequence element accessory protein TnpB [Chthoniobacteraceae bacterium]